MGGWGIAQRCPRLWRSGASLRSAASHPKCVSYLSAAPKQAIFVLVGLAAAGVVTALSACKAQASPSRQYHVAIDGDDAADGSQSRPLRTISAAAQRATRGDSADQTSRAGREQPKPTTYQATVVINPNEPSKPYSPMIFGGFLEQFGRQV